ncbi:Probable cytochrome c oxidase biogenesis protein YpmQ [Flavobacterium indicum GPTSA100-9 = DSM 17447]|jgi:protein SCO1/2|uniref:Probable cytochrome c oxidase biogenesis protein YpmQ n=1 Tax=Flavobacterium indicum (strain DSM 17447 / CIP 109464 / GPTSA100-9) TaxID=1094466 RepID=H8XQ64_FLAIG|nr:SCO family protein [Flavobacterium indicum]CCG52358.1 Probable cytochrome c oxidase biogenesis protein YpmQ [Flavobacterium indicum GPTSA100-9 = DSM 17447]
MKNKSYIGISFIVLLFGIWTVKELRERYNKNELDVLGNVPSFSLIDQNNKKITNEDYKGKVYVVEFFFSSCPSICPRMNQNMLKLQDAFYGNLDFGIASITIDPENDTSAQLKQHAKDLGVKHPNWHFLTGDYNYIMNLANKGFNIYAGKNKNVAGGFEHSGLFALIDKEGKIRCRKDKFGNPILYYDGLEEAGIKAIKEDIKLLLEE